MNTILEERIQQVEELVEIVKALLKEQEGNEFKVKYIDYDADEEDFENEDGIILDYETMNEATIFNELGWSRSDQVLIKRLYLIDGNSLMIDLLRYPYYPWPGEFGEFEPDDGWSVDQIIDRFSECFTPDMLICVLKNIIEWMENE